MLHVITVEKHVLQYDFNLALHKVITFYCMNPVQMLIESLAVTLLTPLNQLELTPMCSLTTWAVMVWNQTCCLVRTLASETLCALTVKILL